MKSPKISKTMWFNGIALVLAVALPLLAAQGYTGEVPEELAVFVPAIIAGVNMILRYFFTDTALRA